MRQNEPGENIGKWTGQNSGKFSGKEHRKNELGKNIGKMNREERWKK